MAALSPRRLKQLQKVLFMGIWLMSLVIFALLVYSENTAVQPLRLSEEDKQALLYGDPETLEKMILNGQGAAKTTKPWKTVTVAKPTESFGEIFQRKRLTQASYPLTLYVPYTLENPQICKGNVTVLIIVHTALGHSDRRNRIRSTFGSVNLFKSNYSVRVAFLLGETSNKSIAASVKEENDKYHDIVQAPFLDTYKNLTLKGVMAFRWISLHCSHAELILKIDDDVFINIFQIVDHYRSKYGHKKRQILCNTMYPSPILRRKTRWRIDDLDVFREVKYYPPYCSGFTVLMTPDTVRTIHHAAHFTPFFWVDDVYLYGLLPSKANITHVQLNKNVTLNLEKCRSAYKKDTPQYVSCGARTEKQFQYFWNRSVLTVKPSQRMLVNKKIIDSIKADTTKPL